MKVSIITVAYNSEDCIGHTIESVLAQTSNNFEYWIIDGKSKDRTIEIAESFRAAMEEKGVCYRIVSEQDKGIYDAMNKGIRMAAGELIGIINSDDYYEPNAVEDMMLSMSDKPYQILYGFLRTLDNGVETGISLSSHVLLRERMIDHPACFVTKRLYDELGAYDIQFISAADYDFMLRMFENKEVCFMPVYKLIANFSTGGMCSSAKAYYDLLKVQKKHGIISEKEYNKTVFKCKIYDFIHGKK